jgi:hypothetical protein
MDDTIDTLSLGALVVNNALGARHGQTGVIQSLSHAMSDGVLVPMAAVVYGPLESDADLPVPVHSLQLITRATGHQCNLNSCNHCPAPAES